MSGANDSLPDHIEALKAALLAEREAQRESVAGAEAMVAYLKLMIAKLKREQYGAVSERGSRLIHRRCAMTRPMHSAQLRRPSS